jgi:hypothetical protein
LASLGAPDGNVDLPALATSLLDGTVTGCRQGDLAHASLASSARFVELDAAAWTSNTVRVMARNRSPSATSNPGPATLSVAVTKRRAPWRRGAPGERHSPWPAGPREPAPQTRAAAFRPHGPRH